MTQRMWKSILLVGLILWPALSVCGQNSEILQAVREASEQLSVYSATLQMTQHVSRGDSTIVFSFDFVPSDRMRIVYSEPASVNGQTMILNGDRFYTYIPSLGRRVWQDVDDESNNQGEEMGFLYDFVLRGATRFFETHPAEVTGEVAEFVLETTGALVEAVELVVQMEAGRQIVWVNREDAVPIAVDIYDGDHLAMEIRVLEYLVNGEIDESLFAVPERT